ncbi:MAG: efflux RND transporter periplasmic adaptor subunit, partial [Candidatus Aminicenantes bacterium]
FVSCGGGEKKTSTSPLEQDAQEQEGHQHEAQETEAQKPEAAEPDETEHQDLHLSPQQQKEWGIVVGLTTRQDVASRITLPGILTLNQNKTAHISSLIGGKVASLAVDQGDRVRKGQLILTINSPEFAQAQADFLRTVAQLNLSRKEYERAKLLLKERAIEEREFLRREAEFEKLSTEVGGLGAILHSYGFNHEQTEELIEKCASRKPDDDLCELADPNLPVFSPLSGTIIFRDVIVGEHVEPNKILFTASDLRTLWALLDAYEKDLPFISKDSQVTIHSSLYPDKEFAGKITTISETIDEKLRTIKIRVEVKNDDGLLKPNMYIQGVIENRSVGQKLLAVPEEAVQTLNGEKIVFILEEKDVFAVTHVELGGKVGNMRIIAKGLEEGQRIVIKGAFNLKAELNKGTFGHTHVH